MWLTPSFLAVTPCYAATAASECHIDDDYLPHIFVAGLQQTTMSVFRCHTDLA